jgi:plastocyanin
MDSPKLSRRKLFVATAIAICLATTMSCVLTNPVRAGRTYHITIEDFEIRPALVRIRAGDTVIWTNNDPVIHTLWFVKADGQTTYEKIGSGGLSDPILPGASWVWVFQENVKLQYYDFERLWITANIDIRYMGGPGRMNALHT